MKSIIFTEEQYLKLKSHLFPGDGLEALALCLAREVSYQNNVRLIITETFNIPHEKCERSDLNLTWSTSDIIHILDRAESEGLSVIKIHSHPLGPRDFSLQDNRSDSLFFPSVHSWCESKNLHCSVVFTEDFILGRAFDEKNEVHPIDKIFVIGSRIQLFQTKSTTEAIPFDERTYDVFKGLRVGVVGCSGTGGWMIELLGRNQIGELVPCDPDILTEPNLTRVVNSKLNLCGINKAVIAANVVTDMGHNTVINILDFSVHDIRAIQYLKTCDVIFGCVDSVYARHILNLLCTYYCIPYFDLGVHISTNEDQLLTAASGYHYIQPGKSSLQSRGIFSAKELADETYKIQSPHLFKRLKNDGYIRGKDVARPAVSAINCKAVINCFEEFQSQILNYRDEIQSFATKIFCAKAGEEFCHQENEFPKDILLSKKVGLGDKFLELEGHLLVEQAKPKDTTDFLSMMT